MSVYRRALQRAGARVIRPWRDAADDRDEWVERLGSDGVAWRRTYQRSLPEVWLVALPGWVFVLVGIGLSSWWPVGVGAVVLGLAVRTGARGLSAKRHAQARACEVHHLDARHARLISLDSIGEFDNRCAVVRRISTGT